MKTILNLIGVGVRRLVRRSLSPEQIEIKRLRRVLHDISDSRPDQHMDIEKNPELVNWICDTCHKASVGAYPTNVKTVATEGAGESPAEAAQHSNQD